MFGLFLVLHLFVAAKTVGGSTTTYQSRQTLPPTDSHWVLWDVAVRHLRREEVITVSG